MPKDLDESVSGTVELVFPDDASGQTYRLRERSVYAAEEVRNEAETDDVPRYGQWMPVDVDGDQDKAWLNVPSQLRKALLDWDVQQGDRFTVDRMQKTGRQESDPYQVEITVPDRDEAGQQDRLTGTSD